MPRVVITDKLASYGAAMRETLRSVEQNSHHPTRQRERAMRRFKSAAHAQRFLSAYGPIRGHFCPGRHRLTAEAYRQDRLRRFHEWDDITRSPASA